MVKNFKEGRDRLSTLTNLLHLIKPNPEEKYNVADFNINTDILESAIKDLQNKDNSQDNLLATKSALESESKRAKESEGQLLSALETEITRATNAENTHNVSGNAHEDIRNLIYELTIRLNTLIDSDDTTLDQLSEIIAYIKSNRSLIENVTTNKVNVADIVDNLTSDFTNKPLSSKQGKILKGLIDSLESASNSHTGNSDIHITATERTNWTDAYDKRHTHGNKSILDEITSTLVNNWNAAKTHASSAHARTDATKVEKSTINGNILINGTETKVYTHPSGTNPHGTTKTDIGLGNVPNVATNDQTPTYTEASALAKLTSGEKLSVAFGKISKAITDLISHIGNKNNPHGVTKSQVGLGNVENKSSATIRSELTKENVTTALGYTPPTSNTTYGAASSSLGLMKSGGDLTISNGVAQVNDDSHNHVISNVDGLQTALDGKASSSHTHSSYTNQNAFSNIKVGNTTISADAVTDILTLVAGNNITLTPDAANDKITISSSGSGNGIIYSGSEPTNAAENTTWID